MSKLLDEIFEAATLILASLSAPRKTGEISKAMIRPILIKGQPSYQITEYRQQQALHHVDSSHPLRIIDFGCDKAYLTFAIYHFLKMTKGYHIQMPGVDLKEEVIQRCHRSL